MSLRLIPISIREAKRYVARWHRHLEPCKGGLFALAASRGGIEPVGVAIVGRPNGRMSQDGLTCEVIRVAVAPNESSEYPPANGVSNACSFLYGKARRAAQALGYQRGITKTREDESGASLRALGLEPDRLDRGQEWDRPSRRRRRRGGHQLVRKLSWTLWDDREAAS